MTLDDIKYTLKNVFEGPSWYGKSVKSTIHDIPVGKALLRLKSSYNIAELVSHMIVWRNYVIKLLVTGKHHEVPDFENFPVIEMLMMDEWKDLVDRFCDSQDRLMELLDTANIDLEAYLPGKSYRLRDVLMGIIHHDIYHAGQLNLLAKFL